MRRHPQCNPECCLSVIMMMNDAVEDVVIFEQEDEIETEEQLDNKNEPDDPKIE